MISVWLEENPGQQFRVTIPSPARGPGAPLLRDALATLDLPPVRVLEDIEQLELEPALKNFYILTANIAGLRTGGTVGGPWEGARELARAVAHDVIDLQEALLGHRLDREALIDGMVRAFAGDPDHRCKERSAPARLRRVLALADRYGLAAGSLRAIAQTTDPARGS